MFSRNSFFLLILKKLILFEIGFFCSILLKKILFLQKHSSSLEFTTIFYSQKG